MCKFLGRRRVKVTGNNSKNSKMNVLITDERNDIIEPTQEMTLYVRFMYSEKMV